MKVKLFPKTVLYLLLILGVFSSCTNEENLDFLDEQENSIKEDILLSAKSLCTNSGSKNVDKKNPVNHGELDDRTCRFDYSESTIGSSSTIWGSYKITAGTSTENNSLSPRMERKFAPRAKPKGGNFQHFKGKFRIESVGGGRGTYIVQAKGKHEGHIDRDPALCLIIARKKVINGKTYFDLYREQITKRGGKFSNNGRKDVYLTRVKQYEVFDVEMKTGFWGKPVSSHYANVKIKGKWYNWRVPRADLATETGIRYGAYSVSSGTARISVSNTSFSEKNN